MKIEIKSLGLTSIFKTTLYFASVPLGLMFVIGVFGIIIGIAAQVDNILITMIPFVVMPFVMIGVYGLFGMLAGLIYNFFAKRFGGLELTIKKEEQGGIEVGDSV